MRRWTATQPRRPARCDIKRINRGMRLRFGFEFRSHASGCTDLVETSQPVDWHSSTRGTAPMIPATYRSLVLAGHSEKYTCAGHDEVAHWRNSQSPSTNARRRSNVSTMEMPSLTCRKISHRRWMSPGIVETSQRARTNHTQVQTFGSYVHCRIAAPVDVEQSSPCRYAIFERGLVNRDGPSFVAKEHRPSNSARGRQADARCREALKRLNAGRPSLAATRVCVKPVALTSVDADSFSRLSPDVVAKVETSQRLRSASSTECGGAIEVLPDRAASVCSVETFQRTGSG